MNKYRPILENYTTLENEKYNIVSSTINSIKQNEMDYCYNKKDFLTILSEANRLNLSVCYKVYNDSDGNFDYCKISPVCYYVKQGDREELVTGQYEYKSIPKHIKCVRIVKSSVKVLKSYEE